jgi:hypothetical protein
VKYIIIYKVGFKLRLKMQNSGSKKGERK